ncbi:MAG: HAMP domain-containing histidine kinase [Gammaproteobacteria bacterium]|nr:HAMP domain-containing histidine kinase [Gammaproteobacteria bacterium]
MRFIYLKHLLTVVAALILGGYIGDWINYSFTLQFQEQTAEGLFAPVAKDLIERFDAIPEERWPDEVSANQNRLDVIIELIQYDDVVTTVVDIDERYYSWLASDGVYGSIFLADGETVLELGPFPVSFWIVHLDTIIRFVVTVFVVALALWLLCASLGRRIDAIRVGAEHLTIRGETVRIADTRNDLIGRAATAVDTAAHALRDSIIARDRGIEDQRDLLHGVAHEFRNPLARIQFASDMAAGTESEEEQKELFEEMATAVSDLDELVKEVLNYSRLRDGHYELKRIDVNLPDVLNEVSLNVKTLYPGIVIEVSGSAFDYETVLVDERMFRRVMMNLIRNAARFAHRYVNVVWNIYPLHFTVRVEDDGQGIPPGKRERLFEPFTRLDQSRSRDSGGVGLGLAVVKSITEKHKGTIRVTDSELGGAMFELDWPLLRPQESTW